MSGNEELNAIRIAEESWETKHAREFETERQTEFLSESGISYKRIYTPLDLEEKGFSYMRDLGFPGEYPYTRNRVSNGILRGDYPQWGDVMSRGTPEENNTLWKTLFSRGAPASLVLVYDLPCAVGYDPDDPRSEGQVGTVGLNFCSLRDWEIAFEGIDIDKLPMYHNLNALPAVVLAYQVAMLQQRGLDVKQMVGVVQNDGFRDYTVGNYYIFPIKHALRQSLDVICWCLENAPNYFPIEIQGYQQREAGHTPVQTGAMVMAEAFFYLDEALKRGVDVDSFAPRIRTSDGGTHATFWENICLTRALRRIWAKALRDRYGAKKPESLMFRGGAGSGGQLACKKEILNNIVRSTVSCVSGLLGGEWARIVPPSEPLGVPATETTHFGLQAQRVLFYETDIGAVVDPLGGSYFIESLTSELEEKVLKELDAIEKQGGMLRCVETGYFQKMRAEATYKWQKAFDKGEIVRVGVNRFVTPGAQQEHPFKPYRVSPDVEPQRIAAVQELRRTRDTDKVKKALDAVKTAAAGEPTRENNIVPPIIEAVKCYATIGEIAGALREVWGEYQKAGTKVL